MRIISGVDICKIERIAKHLKTPDDPFVKRCFTSLEIDYCMSHKSENRRAESFAARYAAKEAASKAIGTGICTQGIGFKDFEVINNSSGAPELLLSGEALKRANDMGVISVSLSLSHEDNYAIAFVTMLSDKE